MKVEIDNYVKIWEDRCYSEGIPDEAPKEIFDKVPSYKNIVIAILKNDIGLLGVQRPKSKYYDIYKKIEIENRKA